MVPPASNTQQQGFVRLINRENRPGAVTVWGLDSSGNRSPGVITLTLNPYESRQFNSQDIEFGNTAKRSEEHTSELQSLMRISYAVFCLKKKKTKTIAHEQTSTRIDKRKQ